MSVSQLRRELAFEIFMAANPYPKPDVACEPLRHGAVIPRHTHRPEARVGAQPLELKGWMRRILAEFLISGERGVSEIIGQRPIKLPEVRRCSGGHAR